MRKLLLSGLTVVALLPMAALPAAAGNPRIYHTISSTNAYAAVVQAEGCLQSEVYVSSSIGKYASQPGPVNKQGLTGVFVRVSDICAGPEVAPMAGGGGGGVVVFEADGQDMTPLVVDNRLRAASVTASIPGTDGDGNPVTIHLAATWTGLGELEHSTVVTHENFPSEGVVNSTANDLRRTAVAEVSVVVGLWTVDGTDPGQGTEGGNAVLEQSKSRCIEVPRPGVEEFYPCFGFPG